MLDTTGLTGGQVTVLEFVADLMRHGMFPRIVNVTPTDVQTRVEADELAPLTDAEKWAVAKQADSELAYDHHLLDGVEETIADAVREVLSLRVERVED